MKCFASHTPSKRPVRRRARRSERGATMVEVTLIVALLLTVIFGIMECGRLMVAYIALSDAARAGTRYATVHGSYRSGSGIDGPSGPGNTANVETAAKNITTAVGLLAASVTVTVGYPDGTNNVGARVTVTVSYPYSAVVSLIPVSATLGSISQGTICY